MIWGGGLASLDRLVTNFPEISTFIIGLRGCLQNLYLSVCEVRTFGTLITSTKVFSLIKSAKLFDHAPETIFYPDIFYSVPRDLRLRT